MPSDPQDGTDLRAYHICKKLRETGNKIFIAFLESPETSGDNQSFEPFYDGVIPITAGNVFANRIYQILINMEISLNVNFHLSIIKTLNKTLRKIVRKYRIDIVHINGHYSGLFAYSFNEKPKYLDLIDSWALQYRRELTVNKKPSAKTTNYLLHWYYKWTEKNLATVFNSISTVSAIDSRELERLCKKQHVRVIQNGIDTDFFRPGIGGQEHRPTAIFHGNMTYLPNINAVNHIVDKVFPIIKSKIPDFQLLVVGRDPSVEIRKLADREGVVVTGTVPDVRKFLVIADVGIYPMISGSGIKNKILEAMAMALPIVTNTRGAESLVTSVKHCLFIKNKPEDMANAVVHLIRDKDKRRSSGMASRKIVKETYSWDNVAVEYNRLYGTMAKRNHRDK